MTPLRLHLTAAVYCRAKNEEIFHKALASLTHPAQISSAGALSRKMFRHPQEKTCGHTKEASRKALGVSTDFSHTTQAGPPKPTPMHVLPSHGRTSTREQEEC